MNAAFDTVDISILLIDLQSIGVGGSFLSWFASYLERRRFKVLFMKEVSDVGAMSTVVPQGRKLVPYYL